MKKFVKPALIIFWLLTVSLAFAALWVRSPSLWFINLPDTAWEFLANSLGATCCESAADLELLVGTLFGLLFAIIFLILGVLLRKGVKGLTRRSSGR